MRKSIIALALCVMLTACQSVVEPGTIVSKEVREARSETVRVRISVGNFPVWVMQTRHVPESFWITISRCGQDGECKQEEVELPVNCWNAAEVGQLFEPERLDCWNTKP